MDLSQVPLFAALSQRMAWLTERQAVLAQNVANADTPGYAAQDLPAPDFRKFLEQTTSTVALATTEPGHIAVQPSLQDEARPQPASDGSKRVNVEDQMMKVSQTANDYALVTTVYRANLSIVKTVLGHSS
jgi:flagellar basal-body rod protein FlgB